MNSRRTFLKFIGVSGLLSGISIPSISNDITNYNSSNTFNRIADFQDDLFYTRKIKQERIILPEGLQKGSKVAIIAPASHASIWELRNAIKMLKRLGLEVEISDTIRNYKKKFRYFSANDSTRADEFMSYIQRDDINAIMACRGGYGVMRIFDMLDFDIIANNPKIIIGYSDITAILNAIYLKTGIITFHGPVGISKFNSYTNKSFKETLFKTTNFEPIVIKHHKIQAVNGGIAKGRLVGGNLTMLVNTLGTDYEINTDEALLFIEEVSEDPYKIDRMLTHLYNSGKFDNIAGIIFGAYKKIDKRYNFYPYRSFTARQVIESRFKKLQVPAVIGFPVGHVNDKATLPIGIDAELNADEQSLTILKPPVK